MKKTNDFPKFASRNVCTGCGACQQICQKNAIVMERDCRGFMYPHLVHERCVKCFACLHVCTVRK